MRKLFTFLLLTSVAGLGSKVYGQCLQINCAPDTTIAADVDSCNAVYVYNVSAIDTCAGAGLIFSEDMESGIPAGWTTGILGGAQDNWVIQGTSGTGIPFGTMMYGVPHSGNGSVEYSYLQTAIFDATGGGDFVFDFYCDNETGSYDQEAVEVSYDGGATWTQVIGTQLPNDANNIQNTSFVIDPADGTSNTTVRFTYNTFDGCCGSQNGFFVDNVSFTGAGTPYAVTQIAGLPSGSSFPLGTTVNTFVTDDGGTQFDTCSFTVEVIDVVAPTMTVPNDTVSCSQIVNGIAPTVMDDCPGATVSYTLNGATTGTGSGDVSGVVSFNPGVTTVTYTATDPSGNATAGSFTVTVNATTSSESATACGSYTWSVDSNTYTSSGDYTAILVNSVGCDSVITLNLTIDNADVTVVETSSTVLTATSTTATGYQWLDCDNAYAPITGATSQSFVAPANGNYAVEVTDNGCVDTSACMAITAVGIGDNGEPIQVAVFPNPTNGQVTVLFGQVMSEAKIIVRNLAGQIMEVYQVSDSEQQVIELDQADGIYFLEIITADGDSAIVKVVKE